VKNSDSIEMFIRQMLDAESSVELKRNELASYFNCVPSQINYVISTRFTTERGYTVESRRGGGGYIKISRVPSGGNVALMHIVNAIGDNLDSLTAEAIVRNLYHNGDLSAREVKIILAACSDNTLGRVADGVARNRLRADMFKTILVNLV